GVVTDISAETPPIKRRHLVACVIGNALEFYDFTVYTFFAIQIGHTFFPFKTPFLSLMASLITFGVGFIGRPIGAVILGAYGDKHGRKPAMLWSFALMGFGVLALALTPSYAAIGAAAPVIVVLARLLQGFALGGEVGPTTAFLMEAAKPHNRGVFTTLQYVSQGANTIFAAGLGYALTFFFDAQGLQDFGWRIAFMVGALILPIGFILRAHLPETHKAPPERAFLPLAEWLSQGRTIVLGILSLAASTITIYVLYFLPTYVTHYLHADARIALLSGLVFGISNLVFSFVGGWSSDKIGRKPVMVIPRALQVLTVVPCFMWLIASPTAPVLLSITAIITMLGVLSAGANLVAVTELLPKHIRAGSLATVYAIAIATFGGTTQPIIAEMLDKSGDLLSPAYYLMGASIVGVIAMSLMPETAPVKTGER
ncbi:MAG TPA: MFS transporter, partial [Rhizomicrobium sp.]|nr:MFS transporter [Rhizomicrobium sp.]